MCMALSGCCPIVVTAALGVPGAIVQAYTKRGPVERKAPVTGGVMSGQFSGLVNKCRDSSPKARASATLREERGRRMTAVIGIGRVGHL